MILFLTSAIYDKDGKLVAVVPTIDWWNAVKLYGKPGDGKTLEQLNAAGKSKLDPDRFFDELDAGAL